MVQNKRAFSLIEILISLTIIALFSGISLAYYNNYTSSKKITGDADTLVDVLELAKKKAISGDADSQADRDCNFKGYKITFAANNTYSLYLLCDSSFLINTYTLSKTTQFNPLPGAITFLPLTGSNNSLQTISLKEISGTRLIIITINNGNISRP